MRFSLHQIDKSVSTAALLFAKFRQKRTRCQHLQAIFLYFYTPHRGYISFVNTCGTQVRTNIGLADTLIPSSFVYIIYIGSTGPRYSIKIIFSNHVYSENTILNTKFGANRTLHVPNTPVYRFGLYGRYRTQWTDEDNCWLCY